MEQTKGEFEYIFKILLLGIDSEKINHTWSKLDVDTLPGSTELIPGLKFGTITFTALDNNQVKIFLVSINLKEHPYQIRKTYLHGTNGAIIIVNEDELPELKLFIIEMLEVNQVNEPFLAIILESDVTNKEKIEDEFVKLKTSVSQEINISFDKLNLFLNYCKLDELGDKIINDTIPFQIKSILDSINPED